MVALFVILTIVVCISLDSLVQWRKSRKESATKQWVGELNVVDAFKHMTAPADMFLDSGHTWVKVSPEGRTDIGLDSFAEGLVGRIDAVVLPEIGKEVQRGDVLFALRQNNRRAAFAAPVDGVVAVVHKDLNWHPDLIHSNPYEEGWVCSLQPKNLARNLKQLRIAEDARTWLKQEAHRFQEFLASRPLENMQLGQVLQDGGHIAGGVLELADDSTWKMFNEIFLQPRRGDEHVD